ncbi:MAG: polyhydroxyalkanoic acid system family protein [Rhodothermales bacterium]|nr:polyhydroxyalkanoic acid system family protein [Rhodothermales bacterium]
MSHIDVSRHHRLGLDGAREAAERVADDLRHEFPFESWWEGNTLRVRGTGFKGRIEAHSETVRVAADLGLVLRPLRGRIRAEVEDYLDRYTRDGADGG